MSFSSSQTKIEALEYNENSPTAEAIKVLMDMSHMRPAIHTKYSRGQKNFTFLSVHTVGAKINFAFRFVQTNTKRSNGSFRFRLFSIRPYRFVSFYSSENERC